jgi:benzoate membrane transport protein
VSPESTFRDFATPAPLIAALVCILAGFSSSIVIVISAADAAHLSQAELSSWIWAISIGSGLPGLVLSLITRSPITCAWSTPGAALLVTSLPGVTYSDAIGAYLVASGIIVVLAMTGTFEAVMRRIPLPIAAAMLSGILFHFGLGIFTSAPQAPGLVALMLATYLVCRTLLPRYAISLALAAGVIFAVMQGQTKFGDVHLALAVPIFIMPTFSLGAIVNIGLPLALVTISGQYIPGLAVLSTAGYHVPVNRVVGSISFVSCLLAPFGCHAVNLAAITAAICAGREAHEDHTKRYTAGVWVGILFLIVGSFGATLAALFSALPVELTATIAGLALLGAILNGLHLALSDVERREPALLTFLCTASGITLFGLGYAFWGLIVGLVAYAAMHILRPSQT